MLFILYYIYIYYNIYLITRIWFYSPILSPFWDHFLTLKTLFFMFIKKYECYEKNEIHYCFWCIVTPFWLISSFYDLYFMNYAKLFFWPSEGWSVIFIIFFIFMIIYYRVYIFYDIYMLYMIIYIIYIIITI